MAQFDRGHFSVITNQTKLPFLTVPSLTELNQSPSITIATTTFDQAVQSFPNFKFTSLKWIKGWRNSWDVRKLSSLYMCHYHSCPRLSLPQILNESTTKLVLRTQRSVQTIESFCCIIGPIVDPVISQATLRWNSNRPYIHTGAIFCWHRAQGVKVERWGNDTLLCPSLLVA